MNRIVSAEGASMRRAGFDPTIRPNRIMTKRVFKLLLLPPLVWFLAGCATGKNGRVASPPRSGPVFTITSYGAVDDPKTSSADAFRRAIDDCRKVGGGIVRVPAGHFLTGPIEMVDNMTCLLYTSPSPRDRTRSRMPS